MGMCKNTVVFFFRTCNDNFLLLSHVIIKDGISPLPNPGLEVTSCSTICHHLNYQTFIGHISKTHVTRTNDKIHMLPNLTSENKSKSI